MQIASIDAQAAPDAIGSARPPLRLSHLGVLEVQGPDAGTFLQGQLTQDVLGMGLDTARAGGYCSAKGRLLGNFVIVRVGEQAWWLVTHAQLLESLAKRLKMFVLRAQCTVTALTHKQVIGQTLNHRGVWSVSALADGDPSTTSGCIAIGWWGGRSLVLQDDDGRPPAQDGAPDGDTSLEAWRCEDILAGWPWIEPATVEQFVPQMVNFEVLGGVNFRKGCYPGQEVVARSQYRGTLKRRMALLSAPGEAPVAGTEIFHSADPGQPAGMVVNAARLPSSTPTSCRLLAELKLTAWDQGTLHLGTPEGPMLALQPLPYRLPTESEM
ncbi:MAG: YgfZ/GcvT domain-containing protein [Burkholderiaceae bacterium]|jgi:folate-binding protein YgfZ